jgi:hypothetical protein
MYRPVLSSWIKEQCGGNVLCETQERKMWGGLCQGGENDQSVAVAVARLGTLRNLWEAGQRGCAQGRSLWEYRRSSRLDVYKVLRACCDCSLGFTVLQCCVEYHFSPNHLFHFRGP